MGYIESSGITHTESWGPTIFSWGFLPVKMKLVAEAALYAKGTKAMGAKATIGGYADACTEDSVKTVVGNIVAGFYRGEYQPSR